MRRISCQASTYDSVAVDMHYRVYLSMFGHLGLLATCPNISSEGSQLPEMALLLDIASPPLRAHPQRPHTRGVRCPRPAEKSLTISPRCWILNT